MSHPQGPVLVTGAGGFVGRVLVPALCARGRDVRPTSRRGQEGTAKLDVTDEDALAACLRQVQPRAVVHLAGMTYLPQVLEQPRESFRVNVLGTRNLLAAVAREVPAARVLLISTCSVFGAPRADELPLVEDCPLRALHPYGVQKIGVEVLAEDFASAAGLDVIVARPFNHVGPGLDPRLSLAFFAKQIVAAERAEVEPVIRVGNLDARRDLTDVRDVVRAYLLLLESPHLPLLLHVASGRSVRIGDALEALVRRARISLEVEPDPSRLRPLDVPELVGDASRLREATGWEARIDLEETYDRILAHARGEDYGGPW